MTIFGSGDSGRRRRTQGQRRLRAARRVQVRALRRNLLRLGAVLVVYNAVVVALWRHRPAVTFAAGLVDGLLVMFCVWLINTRTYNLTMGTWAEEWTSDLFGKQKGWRIADNLPVDGYDIDHIVIAPGGVLAVESKYYGPTPIGRPDGHEDHIERHLKTAKNRAGRAARLLAEMPDGHRTSVTPVLMLWGVGTPEDLSVECRGGVWLVSGNEPDDLIKRFGGSRVDAARAARMEQSLRAWATQADRELASA